MYKLFLFILRFHFVFLFLGLQTLCFVVIFNYNNYHRSYFINTSNFISGHTLNAASRFWSYLNLVEVNENLSNENANLQMQVQNNQGYSNSVVSNPNFGDDSTNLNNLIPAKVINNSIGNQHNYFTLNKGSNHGITPDMGVIAPSGLVGIVKQVSRNFSTVVSILNTRIKIGGRIGENEFTGTVIWKGHDSRKLNLETIPVHADVRVGSNVVTSGYSSIFPENILIGEITSVKEIPGSAFYEIELTLSTNMQSLNYVYVTDFILKTEKDNLESESYAD
ncbi:MAG: rod shape-determining protein MreC [Bacteroidetes bacterium]|nr:rod shape-determining protein MreC [Bacteroidota bacterium]